MSQRKPSSKQEVQKKKPPAPPAVTHVPLPEQDLPAPALMQLLQRTAAAPEQVSSAEAKVLQRAVGNQALGRLGRSNGRTADPIQRKALSDKSLESIMGRIGGKTAAVQRQEEEEDIQMKPAGTIQRQEEEEEIQMKPADAIQRQEEEEDEEEMIQLKADTASPGPVTNEVESQIQSSKSGGSPMSQDLKGPMEQAFGADFSGVRLHTDSQADGLNQSLQAKAFTTGDHIYFRGGEYNPGSSQGQELIAHELTHTIQQSPAKSIQRKDSDQLDLAAKLRQESWIKAQEARLVLYARQNGFSLDAGDKQTFMRSIMDAVVNANTVGELKAVKTAQLARIDPWLQGQKAKGQPPKAITSSSVQDLSNMEQQQRGNSTISQGMAKDSTEEGVTKSLEGVPDFLGGLSGDTGETLGGVGEYINPATYMSEEAWTNLAKSNTDKKLNSTGDTLGKVGEGFGFAGSIFGGLTGLMNIGMGVRQAVKDKGVTWENAEDSVVKIMEGVGKTAEGIAGAVTQVIKWAGGQAVEGVMKIVGEGVSMVKGIWNGIVGVFKTVIAAKGGKAWEAFTNGAEALLEFAKGGIAGAQMIFKIVKGAGESIPFVGAIISFIDGLWNTLKAIVSIAKTAIKMRAADQKRKQLEQGMLHQDKPRLLQKLRGSGLYNRIFGKISYWKLADFVRKLTGREEPKDEAGKKDFQELKEWALDLHLVEISTKRQKKGLHGIIGNVADLVAAVISMGGAIAEFISDVVGVATAGIGNAAAKAIKIATTVTSLTIKIGKAIVSAGHTIFLGVRQFGRNLAAKGKLGSWGKKLFNTDKTSDDKRRRRVTDAITLMKELSTTGLPDPKMKPKQQQALKPEWEKVERRLDMTGVDTEDLAKKDGEPEEQAALIAKAMAGRDL